MGLTRLTAVVATWVMATGLASFAPAQARAADPSNLTPPQIAGVAVVDSELVADPGIWEPAAGLGFSFAWFADGEQISGADQPTFRPRAENLGRSLRVRVIATDVAGASAQAMSQPTAPVASAVFAEMGTPTISGVARYTRVLQADVGGWAPAADIVVDWLRDGQRIGHRGRQYTLGHRDVGHRISVRLIASRPGYATALVDSAQTAIIRHRIAVRKRVTYHVETRGAIEADLAVFKDQVAQTYADPRGWRSAGVEFARVKRGGDFTVVLAAASQVPSFSSVCSSQWSCRVGRYVIINQTRWQTSSSTWLQTGLGLRNYRHMVLNHETGHWLGHRHEFCGGVGQLAPVMQQQSKGLQGCRANPWPRPRELWFR